jgi:hypothetical protein
MILAAWIFLIIFGTIGLHSYFNIILPNIDLKKYLIMFGTSLISTAISAVSAGVIWGGLFQ